MTIAVDFDGTIVEHKYPHIGAEIPFAIETLKKLQQDKHRIILWTVREGKLLDEAIEFCHKRGLNFYAVNKDFPEETQENKLFSRKLKADLFIDDRNVGGLPEWGVIYRMVKEGISYEEVRSSLPNEMQNKKKKRNIFIRIGETLERNKH